MYQAAGPSFDGLQKQGDAIVRSVKEYQARTGSFPLTLEEAGISAKARFGGWQYQKSADPSGFYLSIGDYNTDEFTLFWDRHTGWCLDS